MFLSDTGTTLVLLASDAFAAYQKATGATLDSATGLLTVSKEQFLTLPPLLFTIDGVSARLPILARFSNVFRQSLNLLRMPKLGRSN